MRRFGYRLGVVIGVALTAAASAGAQEISMAERGPRFLVSAPSGPAVVDVGRTPVLRRRITLELRDVTLGAALEVIARESGLRLGYSRTVVPVGRVVRLVAEDITVAGALSEVLFDTGVDVLFERDGQAAIVRRDAVTDRVPGTVTGRVTDAKTGGGLAGAEVALEGTRWRTGTGEDGRYRLADVTPGSYTLVVRRIGYVRRTQPVTVVDGEEVTVDVALEPVPTRLDEVVTTVTGDQRRRELGHVVGRINADSLVKEAPISSLSELLTARVPGVQVFQQQGTVGGMVRIQVRGANSLLLSNEPIVVVDGVRYTTKDQTTQLGSGPWNAERTTPLNDINPNDIESIEIVKGPSAATLYGTDAANGVIVVTTKRGHAGPARWNLHAKTIRTSPPDYRYPDLYWGWRTVGGVPSMVSSCSLASVAQGTCVQDSVTALPNPLNEPQLSIFRDASAWTTGAAVSGGRQDFRYYFSGDVEDATGMVQMPPYAVERLKAERGLSEVADEQLRPNRLDKMNLRVGITAALSERAELQVNTGYVHSKIRSISDVNPFARGVLSTNPANPYGRFDGQPHENFNQTSTERTDRFVGSARLDWRLSSWLRTGAQVGLDFGTRNRYSLARRGAVPSSVFPNGAVSEDRVRQVATTVDVDATATVRRGPVSSRTSVGVQYQRNLLDGLLGRGVDLPPGGTSIGEAASSIALQSYNETVTLGSFLEETVGLNDRLFLTGAVRADGASTFGNNYDAAVYPKLSASWMLTEEPFIPRLPLVDEVRLRYAFGMSGQQPDPDWGRVAFLPKQGVINGTPQIVAGVSSLGNPNIKPERVKEHEFGIDVSALSRRVQLGLTWYQRDTRDQIASLALPLGMGSIYTNLGLTTQHGFELELSGTVLETRALSLDLAFNHGLHRTKLVDLGGAREDRSGGGWVEGYPLGSRFRPDVRGFSDADGNGIISSGEVQLTTEYLFVGEGQPPVSQTLSAVVGMFERRLRLSAVLDRRAGFVQSNRMLAEYCGSRCRAAVDPAAPLEDQALAVARSRGYGAYEPGDYTRLREVTAAFDLPAAMIRALRVSSATLSLAGRNLAVWTDFTGPDPEGTPFFGGNGSSMAPVPQTRSWTLRLDLGF